MIIIHFKNHKMTLRILLMSLLPLLSIAQSNSKVAMPKNTQSNDKGPVELKRNALYNLDEIKVRWKKAALENCPGVPCAVTPAFTCGTSTVTDVDGNTYNTKLIGTQCWTKTNLKVTKYNDGTLIGDSTNSTWGTAVIGARTGYDVSVVLLSDYVGTFGYLYNWYAVNDSRKLCPAGWHVPTDAEWSTLTTNLGGDGVAGGKMKSTGTTYWDSPNTNATNSSDFSLPLLLGDQR